MSKNFFVVWTLEENYDVEYIVLGSAMRLLKDSKESKGSEIFGVGNFTSIKHTGVCHRIQKYFCTTRSCKRKIDLAAFFLVASEMMEVHCTVTVL